MKRLRIWLGRLILGKYLESVIQSPECTEEDELYLPPPIKAGVIKGRLRRAITRPPIILDGGDYDGDLS